ncbi:MAG: PulJ/GspJ family protein [Janthinobacterium lividum]
MSPRDGARQRSKTASQAGFTLIEVLAALVVTGAFVVVALPYAGRLATHWWTGEAAVEEADGWIQAMSRMGDDLSQSVAYDLGTGSRPSLAFRADPDDVSFVRSSLGEMGQLEAVTYEVRRSKAGMALIRRSRRFDAAVFGRDDGGTSATLLDGPYRLRLVEVSADGSRRREWEPSPDMPAGVEVSAAAMRDGRAGSVAMPTVPFFLPIATRGPAAARTGASGEP